MLRRRWTLEFTVDGMVIPGGYVPSFWTRRAAEQEARYFTILHRCRYARLNVLYRAVRR